MTSRRRAGIRVNQRNRRRGATAITSIARRLQVAEHHQIPPPSLKCVFRSIRPGIPVQSGQRVRSISARALGCGRARVGSVSVVTRSGSRTRSPRRVCALRGRLGQAARRHGGRDRAARPAAPPRARPLLRPQELAHETSRGDRPLGHCASLTSLSSPAWWPVLRCRSMAGFEVSTEKQEELLNQLSGNFTGTKVAFSWEIDRSPNFHARSITTDTQWKISLDRGLDIFQRFETGLLSVEQSPSTPAKLRWAHQYSRRCRKPLLC